MKRVQTLLVGISCFVSGLFAQVHVTGTVYDETGEPAIGVNIEVEGTTMGTITDFDGFFELDVPSGVKNLIMSYVGYKTETVPVKPNMKVTLRTEALGLEEVVVTGMVKQDKRLFTGAATKVDAENAKLDGVADVSRSLEGRASGVSVQNVSGTFGTAPKIRVRGATSIYGTSKPLWVVDGVVLEDAVELSADELSSGDAQTLIANSIAGINADDIESFQILKDGSATSIYGARAMAGVIVVTTKKGQVGQTHLNYTGEFTYRMKPSYKDYNICNSQEQMGIYQELRDKGWLEASALSTAMRSGVYGKMFSLLDTYIASSGEFGLNNTSEAINGYLRQAEYRNTDWFDKLYRNTIMMNHSISFSMGTERAQVYASLSALYDPGWDIASQVQRYTGAVKANFNILPTGSKQKLTFGINTTGSYRKQKSQGASSLDQNEVTGGQSRNFDINPFYYAMTTSRAMSPTEKYRNNYCDFNIFDEIKLNTLGITVTDIKFQGELNYSPIKGLEFAFIGALRYNDNVTETEIDDESNQARAYRAGVDAATENDLIRDSNPYLYQDPEETSSQRISVLPEGGIYSKASASMLAYDFRGTVSYNHGFANDGSEGDDHIINLFAGAELNASDRKKTGFDGYGYQFRNGGIPYLYYKVFKQAQEEGTNYYYREMSYSRNLAFFGMATYSYKSRYTINGTIRYEGSNQLGKSTRARWLPTWNVSGAWNAHEERWWNPTFDKWWTNATLKLSYSLTATRGPASNSSAIFQAYSPWRPLASVTETGIELAALENSELTYEKKHEFNVGVAFGFVENRINFEFDYYLRNNFDLIGYVQTSGVGGVIDKLANDATLKSSGQEFTLSTINIRKKNFTWTTDLIFSHATNKITKLHSFSNIISLVDGMGRGRREGYEIGALFSIPFAGLTEEGLPTFWADKEHTKKYTPDNYDEINFQDFNDLDFLKYEGSLDPTIYGSFNNTFTLFKDLRIGIFLTYSFGNVVRLDPLEVNNTSDFRASMKEMKNRWVAPGDEARTNIPVIPSKRQYQDILNISSAYSAYDYSDLRVAKGDFIRLKEIFVEYKFPQKWFENQKVVSSFSAKFSGTNLALLYADKKLNGRDPEYYNVGGVSSPVARQFTLTLRLGL